MSNADWYARKMREKREVSPPGPLPPTPIRMPSQATSDTPPPGMAAPAQVQYNPQQAQAGRNSSNCPKCGSGNFMKAQSTVAPRCYDCGYVDGRDYQQEAFTASSVNNTQATKQVPTSGYSPGQIVGRIE